jgi:arginine/lysine/ornithine decarboxylase
LLKSHQTARAISVLSARRSFQLGTYDGTIYNARQVVDKIGHLCDYILFDSAWVGYERLFR